MAGENLVTQLLYPGQPNPRSVIPPASLVDVTPLFQLPVYPASRERPCVPGCWPPGSGCEGDRYAFLVEDGRLAFVQGQYVRVAGQTLFDKDSTYSRLARTLLANAIPPPADVDCVECASDLGEAWLCPQCNGASVGIDLRAWEYARPIIYNNCYSYAWRRRWCRRKGSQPGNIHITSVQDVLEGLEIDGLCCVPASRIRPGGPFIAFFTDGGPGYHFARLDGRYWTHKAGGEAALTCDADGRSIPVDGLGGANMLHWRLHSYYEIPEGAQLSHCF